MIKETYQEFQSAVELAAPVVRERQEMPHVRDVIPLFQKLFQNVNRRVRLLVQFKK